MIGNFLLVRLLVEGYGIVLDDDWQAGWFNSCSVPSNWIDVQDEHAHWVNVGVPLVCDKDFNINLLELIPVWLGILRIVRRVRNVHVLVKSDNTQVVNNINFGKSANTSSMCLL